MNGEHESTNESDDGDDPIHMRLRYFGLTYRRTTPNNIPPNPPKSSNT